jgi:hypothetical protein
MNEKPKKTQRLCSVVGCSRPHLARDWCGKHWRRWHRHGDPLALVIGQDGDNPSPCRVCGTEIAPRERGNVSVYCSDRCLRRAHRERMNALRERVIAGIHI